MPLVILIIICIIASILITGYVLKILLQKNIMDTPNHRSNHKTPTPRGGGIAITLILLPAILWIQSYLNIKEYYLLASIIILATISFIDDVKPLPPLLRFLMQIIAIIICIIPLYADSNMGIFFGYLPLWLDMTICAIGWLWFINLYNFMDGIDGITTTETISISSGIIAIAAITLLPLEYIFYASCLIAVSLGFMYWNWHPAKIFMGDIGSISLGFILGYLLIKLSLAGYILPCLIIASYYLFDSTLTIIKRLINGKKIWEAHSEHLYQQAVRNGKSHSKTATYIAICNANLILMAIASLLNNNLLFGTFIPIIGTIISITILTKILVKRG
jgi:UDP-N-acetylmuramyl pentapeptide phosphotransferase/UDP-N-acetylglucosamine-1-phosphate transferase